MVCYPDSRLLSRKHLMETQIQETKENSISEQAELSFEATHM